MESAVVSQSAPAETEDLGKKAQAELLELFGNSGYNIRGGRLHLGGYTFCACCGSQYMDKDGNVGVTGFGRWISPSLDGASEAMKEVYGPLGPERIGKTEWDARAKAYNRHNKPGVTIAFMEKDKALDLLYSDEYRKIADGYEINDKDQGHPVSVLWLNA